MTWVMWKYCFGPFGDSVSAGARQVHDLRQMYNRLKKTFLTHQIEFLGDMGHVESCFGPFGDSVSVGARYKSFRTHSIVSGNSF